MIEKAIARERKASSVISWEALVDEFGPLVYRAALRIVERVYEVSRE